MHRLPACLAPTRNTKLQTAHKFQFLCPCSTRCGLSGGCPFRPGTSKSPNTSVAESDWAPTRRSSGTRGREWALSTLLQAPSIAGPNPANHTCATVEALPRLRGFGATAMPSVDFLHATSDSQHDPTATPEYDGDGHDACNWARVRITLEADEFDPWRDMAPVMATANGK